MNPVLPDHLLKRVAPAVRAAWGRAGMTAAEAEASFVAKNESDLQVLIKTMLNRNGVHVIRSRMDKRTTTQSGTPDLIFAVTDPRDPTRGIPVAWEVKMPKCHPTKEQVETMADMTRNGWKCSVIHSYDEALTAYKTLTQVASLEAE